ncbi:ABC transporter substrate-binding protein [Streptomyces sp. NPDC007872]|uniref:ABC transporter substrate-binding protein n=1 Tax=Streptomyces sp. NPDC007872 TaxID=3364782 RepID=UPI003695012C
MPERAPSSTPSVPTPTVPGSSGAGAGPARHRAPDRPTAPPVVVAPDDQPPTLDATAPPKRDDRTSREPRGLTRRSAVLGAALVVLARGSLLARSLTRDHDPRGGGTGGSGSAASPLTVRIGVDAPLGGGPSSMGTGIRSSAELAVRTADETGHVPGVTFEVTPSDDGADPAEGAANATRTVSDDKLFGAVGPPDSAVALTLVPVLSRASVVDVSPGNTDPALTPTGSRARAPVRTPPASGRSVTPAAMAGSNSDGLHPGV